MIQAHGKGVVAAGGAAHPDAQSSAHADEQRPGYRGQQGQLGNLGPQGRELFADAIAHGIAAGGHQ